MLHKSRTLMANEEKASFLNTQNGMNKQDKGSRRFTVFIGHFKRRSKSADQSNKELFHNANNLRNNLIGNKPNTSSYQPFFTGFHTARTNRHSSEHENQYSGNPLWASLNLPGEYNFDFDSIMSTSAHETACSSNSHQVGLQMDRKPRPASFHPASQILTHHHNPHFYQTRIFSSAIEEASCTAFSPYPYCHHNNSHYMQSSKQNKISSNMIMYDSVYDYPPTLSPYPCPIYIPPSEDITPTNENVNPCLSNSRARIQPTSVDFHRIRKMHSSMKQFFSFSGNKKDNLPKKSIANHVLGKERDVINPSFFDCDNSNNNHSVPSTGNLSSRLSINSSNNINFKGTVLRSFSCTPKSICDNKHRVKSQVLKTQNVSLNATTATTFTITTKTNTTTNNDNICDRRTKTKNDPTMCRIDTRSRLHAYCSRTKPTNGYESSCSSVYSRNSNHANYKFSIVKSPSTCQVTTCHNVPKLSSKTMQKGSDRPVSLTNCKFMNNTVKRKSTASTANGTSTTTITTTNTTINNIVDSNITSALNTTKTSATTSQVPCMINNSDYYINVNHSTPHNTLTNENKVYPSFADRKMVNKKMEDPLLLSVSQSFNGDNDDKAEFLYTTSLLDYLSSTANVSFNQSTMNKLNSNNNGSLPLNVATTGNSINHFLYFLPDSKVIDNDQVMSMKSYDMCSTMKQK
ncbi:unnamed protein product [Heterobilharzia americana]|nr:unnamed protein product [Heterobilharzia americana]